MNSLPDVSLNALAQPLVDRFVDDAVLLGARAQRQACGAMIIDAGVDCVGSLEAGLRIAEICMAGLGRVQLVNNLSIPRWPWAVQVSTSQPLLACLGSQYAGWSLSETVDDRSYFAMASGPGRALAKAESLFNELAYGDSCDSATLILESSSLPPEALSLKVAEQCGIEPSRLNLLVTPTGSLAGSVQIASRICEVAMHKAHELQFPLQRIVDVVGITPLPPPIGNDLKAMGRTNDTILFGGQVQLYVSGAADDAKSLAEALPSTGSSDYGEPFEQIFEKYDHDFFKIDGHLFSPGQVAVTAIESGKTFFAGWLSPDLIDRSFGYSGADAPEG